MADLTFAVRLDDYEIGPIVVDYLKREGLPVPSWLEGDGTFAPDELRVEVKNGETVLIVTWNASPEEATAGQGDDE